MHSLAIGVDLGGTNLRIGAVDESGRDLGSLSTPALVERGPREGIDEISNHIAALTTSFRSAYRMKGIGLGIPGILDLDNGSIHSAGNLPGWSHFPLREELEQRLALPVYLENDANCAALGEKWLGAGRSVDDLCMITLGTGVGGGFVVGGKPWHGIAGMAGEIGHMTVVPDGVACTCGSRGCLEQYASARAIHRMALQAVSEGQSAALAEARQLRGELSAKEVFDCAQRGDPASLKIFETVGRSLGIALANLINVFNLPLYVIGGGVANSWDLLRPAVFAELSSRSIVFRAGEPLQAQHRSTTIMRALLGERAGVLGAARLPMLAQKCSNCFSATG